MIDENRSLFQKIDYLPVHLGLGAGLISTAFSHLLEFQLSFIPGLVASTAMFGIYAVNNKFDLEEDLVNKDHVTRRLADLSFYGGTASLVISFLLAVIFKPILAAAVLFLVLSVTLYSVPILPERSGYRRIKEIPYLKNIFVASVWGIFCVSIPVMFTGILDPAKSLTFFAFTASQLFTATVIPDIRDMEGDRKSGVKTIPALHGVSGANKFNLASNTLGLLAHVLAVYLGLLPVGAAFSGIVFLTAYLPILSTTEENSVEMTQISELNFLLGYPLILAAGMVLM